RSPAYNSREFSHRQALPTRRSSDLEYFDKRKGRTPNRETVRFETAPAEQAQLDWKEDIRYITKDGEIISVNVFVFLLGYSRFRTDRKSTRLNSSHVSTSYAVFCLQN